MSDRRNNRNKKIFTGMSLRIIEENSNDAFCNNYGTVYNYIWT